MARGTFITFEGPEGAGKSTQIARLAAYLGSRGHDVVSTYEPGGTELGKHIRTVLFDFAHGDMTARTELLLINAARAQHVEQVIRPALEAGKIVLCDRFTESSLAYQGYGRELGVDLVGLICDFATAGLKADLVLLLDIDAEQGLWRNRKLDASNHPESNEEAIGAETKANRFEAAGLDFHRRVRDGFLELAGIEPARFILFDARCPPDELEDQIRRVVTERLNLK